MPSDRTIRPGATCRRSGGWLRIPPPYEAGEVVDLEQRPITLASIEQMLGMSSTVDIANNLKSYIMDNLTSIDEANKSEVESKVDRIIEALCRNNYMPTRRVYRTPPTHLVYLDDESVDKFINKISKCSYIKWRLASPIYWGWDNIGIEGVFKR